MAEVEVLEKPTPVGVVPADHEEPMTIVRVIRILRGYLPAIAVTLLAVAVALILGLVGYYLRKPVQRSTTLGFRLEFPGADSGQYPNGVRFSGSDIIDTPVLRTVHQTNNLGRFIPFADFSQSIVVLEANAALQELAREYEAKLSNPKLSPIERERLEDEYNAKRGSLRKNDYAIVMTTSERVSTIPQTATSKALYDILRHWAEFSSATRQVLLHRVPLVSEQAIARQTAPTGDILPALLSVRTIVAELKRNIDNLQSLPGAEITRSSNSSLSLSELELELAQIERTGVEYLIATIINTGAADKVRAAAVIESQLEYDRRALASADERVRVLRAALDDYLRKQADAPKQAPVEGEKEDDRQGTIMLSEGFLNRLVDLTQESADREYRQRYVDEIREASLGAVPLRATVAYEEKILAELRSAPTGANNPAVMAHARTEYDAIVKRLRAISVDLRDIRRILSRSLSVSGQMYTVTMPPTVMTQSSVSLTRLALAGILMMIVATVLTIAGVFLHYRMQRDRNGYDLA